MSKDMDWCYPGALSANRSERDLAGRGAGHAPHRAGPGLEPFGPDRPAAALTPSVRALLDPLQGSVDVGEALPGLVPQRRGLAPLPGDGRALGIVLVVRRRPVRVRDEVLEGALQRCQPGARLLAFGGQQPLDLYEIGIDVRASGA